MRIVIVGAGPGGLYLATLLQAEHPEREVVVLERNPRDAAFGFGVVFSDNTMSALERDDPRTTADLAGLGPSWDQIAVGFDGPLLRCGGIGFTSIARRELLSYLQDRAEAAGVEVGYETAVTTRDDLPDHDLLVAADGLNSVVRGWDADAYGYHPEVGDARFIWLGTDLPYDCLTFVFARSEHGAFGIHGYPFENGISTFLIETDEATWRAAGFDEFDPAAHAPGESDEVSVAYLRELCADHLGDHRVLANNSRWQQFTTVRNRTWSHDRTVLIGDAAHTAHFSVGSGTRMAMADALALSQALDERGATPEALAAYEQRRRPEVERIQAAAAPSLRWWEDFGNETDRDLPSFAFHFLTRTPRITRGSLARRDPGFVRAVDRWWAARVAADPAIPAGTRPDSALGTPLTLGSLTLANRVAVTVGGDGSDDEVVAGVGGHALAGAGLVVVDLPTATASPEASDPAAGGRIEPGPASASPVPAWSRGARVAHERTAAKVAVRTTAARLSAPGDLAAAGADLLVVAREPGGGNPTVPSGASGPSPEDVARIRAAWPASLPLAAELLVPGVAAADAAVVAGAAVDEDAVLEQAKALAAAGTDLLVIGGEPGVAGWRLLVLSQRLRDEVGVATMLDDGVVPDADGAESAVLSLRADLWLGAPRLAGR